MRFGALGDFVEISAGYPLRGAVDNLPTGDMAIIQMRNTDPEFGVNWAGVKRVELPSKKEPNFLEAGDVIFTTRGARNFAIPLEVVPGKAVCSPHFFVFRIKQPNMLDPAFLAWQINQRPTQEYFQREATGSYILNIRREVVEKLPIALPAIVRQKAIAAFAAIARAERATLTSLIENRAQQMEAIALGLSSQLKRPQA